MPTLPVFAIEAAFPALAAATAPASSVGTAVRPAFLAEGVKNDPEKTALFPAFPLESIVPSFLPPSGLNAEVVEAAANDRQAESVTPVVVVKPETVSVPNPKSRVWPRYIGFRHDVW